MAPRAPHPADPALSSMGLALVGALLLDSSLLGLGGLAVLAVAALVAVVVGVPSAVSEWRQAPVGPAWRQVAEAGLVRALGLLVVAAIAAPLVRDAGTVGVVAAAGLWAVAAALARWPRAGGLWALLGVAGATVLGAADLATTPGFTLLDPRWDAVATWGPAAIVAGLVMATAGLGQWTVGPRRRPGQSRAPWAAAGAAVLMAWGLAAHHGASFEVNLGQPVAGGAAVGLAAVALVAAACTVLARQVGSVPVHAVLGWVATLWFAGPAHGALTFWWQGVLPLGLAACLLAVAARHRGASAAAPALGALLALGAAVAGWPGVPSHALDAAAIGVSLVTVFWVVATSAARRARVA